MKKFLPLFLNIEDKSCLIIGGGEIACRKAKLFLEYGCRVTCISPEATEDIEKLSAEGKIILISKSYENSDMSDFDFVVTATGNKDVALNALKMCKEKKAVLICADFPELSGAISPAIINQGNLSLAISTNGQAPFYAKFIKNKILGALPGNLEEILDLAATLRKELRGRSLDIQNQLYDKFNKIDWDNILEQGGIENAAITLQELIKGKHEKE